MGNVVLVCWVYKYCLGIVLAQTISDEGYKKIELEIARKLILAPLIRARDMSHDYYVQLISRLLSCIFSRQM